jgi:hypothetical protein
MRRQSERGQTLPVWLLGIIATFGIMFFALNYGNAVRMQLRAQNAADAAAQNLLAIQTQRWNLMMETLYASNVEEFRLRKLLDGMLLSLNDSGYCQISAYDILNARDNFANGQCAETYNTLRTAFMKSANRYSADVQLLQDVTAQATDTNWVNDAKAMLVHMKNTCNATGTTAATLNAAGGDCAFTYTIPSDGITYETGLYDVEMDAYGDLVPGLGRYASSGKRDTETKDIFDPAKIEVVACAKVPPLIPNFGPLKAPTFYAIARSAAQSTQFVQDWFEPGTLLDPARTPNNQAFQPYEIYNGVQPGVSPTPNEYYDVDFGGNTAIAATYQGVPFFAEPFQNAELSARLGWWNAIPTPPFSTKVSIATDCPTS